jgi:predicted house-cleaning noncanonical NTP pyrophosphatase (MazG superfamily)
MKYNKLVRDKIPEIIGKKGEISITHIASDQEYWLKLKDKLKEEVDEFYKSEKIEEIADFLEVIYTICKYKKIDFDELEKIRKRKLDERGGLEGRIILDEVK